MDSDLSSVLMEMIPFAELQKRSVSVGLACNLYISREKLFWHVAIPGHTMEIVLNSRGGCIQAALTWGNPTRVNRRASKKQLAAGCSKRGRKQIVDTRDMVIRDIPCPSTPDDIQFEQN